MITHMQNLSERLIELGDWTRRYVRRRKQAGANRAELTELIIDLGKYAIINTGTWIGTSEPAETSGQFEIDSENSLTQLALSAATSMNISNHIVAASGEFSSEKYDFLKEELERIAETLGLQILASLPKEA